MTVSSTNNKASYSANGSTTTFAYNFKITAASELKVFIRSAAGTETLKTLTTHYTITNVGVAGGGNVVFVTSPSDHTPANGETVVIQRVVPLTQATDYVENDPFPAATHEAALDKLTFVAQQLQEELNRTIKLSVTNTMTSTEFTTSATDRASKLLAFDSAGELSVTTELGTFKGNWAASTDYVIRDLVKDTSTGNIFFVNTAHTSSGSQPLTSNANSAKYTLLVDAASATNSASAAATSAQLADDYAVKVNGAVTGSDFSSKAHAIGGTGVDNGVGSAKDWATKTSGTVGNTSEYSAKYYATLGTVVNVANNINDISTVAGQISPTNNIATVAGINSDITAVAADATDIGAVAGKATEIGLLGTSQNISNMAALNGTNVITHMANLNGTNVLTNISNLNGTNVLTHIANLNASGVLTNIAALNASGVLTNIATVAGDTTEVGQVAGIASDVTAVAGKISDVEAVAHLEDGTTATSAVSNLAARSSDMQTLAPRSSDMQSLATKATEIGRIGASAGNITNLNTLGTTDAVADMNTLAAISGDITSLANSLEKTYTVTVAGGVFVLDGSNNPGIEVFRGNTYIFNQNAATNDGHPLVFKNGSSAYEVGVTYYLNGSATTQANYINTTTFNAGRSSGDRKVIIEVASTAPSSGLRYYCYVHGNGMGNTITVKDSNISLVAGSIANVNNTGGSIANVNSVAAALTNINAVANNATNINTVAGDATEITAVANNATNINAVAGNATNINTVAGDTTEINAVAGNATNINAVASNASNINTVAGANSNVSTVATNINSINDFADKYRIGSSDPGSSNDEGDLFYNTTSNVLKVYNGSAWEAGVTAGSGFAALSGANFTGAVDVNDTLTANTIALDNGSNDWTVTVSSNNLIFSYAGTGKMKLESNGNLTVTGDIVTEGTI